jgi:hypothetical protein
MKLTPFSFNFILTLKVDLDPTYLIQTIFIFVSIVKAVSQKCKQWHFEENSSSRWA